MTCTHCNGELSKERKGYGAGRTAVCIDCVSRLGMTQVDITAFCQQAQRGVDSFAALIQREQSAHLRFNSPNCG